MKRVKVIHAHGFETCRDELEFISAYRRLLSKAKLTIADRTAAKQLWGILQHAAFETLEASR